MTSIRLWNKQATPKEEVSREYKSLLQIEYWLEISQLVRYLRSDIAERHLQFGKYSVVLGNDFAMAEQVFACSDSTEFQGAGYYYQFGRSGPRVHISDEPIARFKLPSYQNEGQAIQDWAQLGTFYGNSDARVGSVLVFVPETRATIESARISASQAALKLRLSEPREKDIHLAGMFLKSGNKLADFPELEVSKSVTFKAPREADGLYVSLHREDGSIVDQFSWAFPQNSKRENVFGAIDLLSAATTPGVEGRPAVERQNSGKRDRFETSSNSYKRIRVIGEGGNGKVFEVSDQEGKVWALKLANYQKLTTEKRKRFKNEINFCRWNVHSNVIQVSDEGFQIDESGNKVPFYVMEKYAQTLKTLSPKLKNDEEKLRIFSKILDGVEAGHLKRVFHRDLKPENILCSENGEQVVVGDFGIAHFAAEHLITSVKTPQGSKLMNASYAAPEQRVKGKEVDQRADIFALGLILNELFTGEVPHGANHKKISDVSRSLAYLDEVVEKMRAQDPGERYQSIDELKKDLIARKADFVQRQKLDELESAVVPESLFNHPFLTNPVEISKVEFGSEGRIVFDFNQVLASDWIDIFKNPLPISGGTKILVGQVEPQLFEFHGNSASLKVFDDSAAHYAVIRAKEYVEMANKSYVQRLEHLDRVRLKSERESIERRLEYQKKNLDLMKTLRDKN